MKRKRYFRAKGGIPPYTPLLPPAIAERVAADLTRGNIVIERPRPPEMRPYSTPDLPQIVSTGYAPLSPTIVRPTPVRPTSEPRTP